LQVSQNLLGAVDPQIPAIILWASAAAFFRSASPLNQYLASYARCTRRNECLGIKVSVNLAGFANMRAFMGHDEAADGHAFKTANLNDQLMIL
jgi:hypothetical protein